MPLNRKEAPDKPRRLCDDHLLESGFLGGGQLLGRGHFSAFTPALPEAFHQCALTFGVVGMTVRSNRLRRIGKLWPVGHFVFRIA